MGPGFRRDSNGYFAASEPDPDAVTRSKAGESRNRRALARQATFSVQGQAPDSRLRGGDAAVRRIWL